MRSRNWLWVVAFVLLGLASTADARGARVLDFSAGTTADDKSAWLPVDGDELLCRVNLSAIAGGTTTFDIQYCRNSIGQQGNTGVGSTTCTEGSQSMTFASANAVTLLASSALAATNASYLLYIGRLALPTTVVPTAQQLVSKIPGDVWRVRADLSAADANTFTVDCTWR